MAAEKRLAELIESENGIQYADILLRLQPKRLSAEKRFARENTLEYVEELAQAGILKTRTTDIGTLYGTPRTYTREELFGEKTTTYILAEKQVNGLTDSLKSIQGIQLRAFPDYKEFNTQKHKAAILERRKKSLWYAHANNPAYNQTLTLEEHAEHRETYRSVLAVLETYIQNQDAPHPGTFWELTKNFSKRSIRRVNIQGEKMMLNILNIIKKD